MGWGKWKFVQNGPGHMTNMAVMPICGKNLKKSSSLEPKGQYDLEGWYAALGPSVLRSLFKWWPWVDLGLFYGKVNLVPYSFVWEKGKTTSNFFSLETARTIEAKFYVEPPWDEGMKGSTNGLCDMTSMDAMPIYGKSL